MQVAMVDVNHFTCVFVYFSVGDRPANPSHFRKVDDAFVVGMVQLGRANKGVHPRGIHIVSQRFDDDPHVIPLNFVEER
jgi:hypothetical protein